MCVLEGYIESHKTLQEIVVAGKVVVVVVDKCASKKVGVVVGEMLWCLDQARVRITAHG